jgi:hypothetical protein
MLSYKEYDNAQAVEIELSGRLSTQEFDKIAPSSNVTGRSACSK